MKTPHMPQMKGFLTCWVCDRVFADYDVIVTASPCVLKCRTCVTGLPLSPKTIQGLLAASEHARVTAHESAAEEVLQ
ncbi:hypothetical protein [Achromobacter insolitus]|uniref:hypothetical protein n=1 Tax=Achromobacter insolitus TaxID=217204 RepID=UPI001EEEF2FC|nr:hypothetical protein [Achromobacter insolitus]